MNLVQRLLNTTGQALQRMASDASKFGTAYKGAAKAGGPFKLWGPRIASPDRDYLSSRNDIVARTRDLGRNHTAAASGGKRRVSSAVGVGWRLSSRVDAEALGLSLDEATQFSRAIEREWQTYAYSFRFEMDGNRQSTFGGLLRTVVNTWFYDGEAFGVLEWRPGEMNTTWGTRLNLIDGDRVSNPAGAGDTHVMRGGIEHDPVTGAPVALHIRSRHPNDVGVDPRPEHWRRVERWTSWGRPQFLHLFDRERIGQSRGVSQLVPALSSMRSLQRFDEATLENAILQALMLGTVESNGGPQAVSEALSAEEAQNFEAEREKIYGGRSIDMNGVALAVLPHGDKVNLNTQGREVASFEGFTRTVLRRVAAAIGCTYEELAMDYSTTNYSSARAAMLHAYAETQMLQALLRDQFVQPLFVAWLEEAIETGRIELPQSLAIAAAANDNWFYDNVQHLARARWIAPGRGYIDPTKEIDAAAKRMGIALSTAEDEAAEQGRDWEEIAEQRARELRKYQELGITGAIEGVNASAALPSQPAQTGGEAPEDQRPQPQPEAA